MRDGFIGHEVKRIESLKDKCARLSREKRGIYRDTRGEKRASISQAKPRGFRYLLICPLILKTFSLEEKL